ncbi:MAG: PIN domain-containing protein [Acidobacteriota bacterium]|nr:MAG: PIN domain-containing protein [Acidobacteriota bacterium]
MIILDANILLYAYMANFPQHKKAADWLEKTLSGNGATIGLIWPVATAFLRLGTNARIFDDPFSMDFARSRLDDLVQHPSVVVLSAGPRHWSILSGLLKKYNITGDLVTDAHIAASSIEHKAIVATSDRDFRRFSDDISIIDPIGG